MADEYILHTDGCCLGNPGAGGTGVVLSLPASVNLPDVTGSRGYVMTTSNRMELRAGIEGLRLVRDQIKKNGCRRKIYWYTDSRYVADNLTNVHRWVSNNWQTTTGEPVLNQDLWRNLKSLAVSLRVMPDWISRDENGVADALAKRVAKNPTHTDLGFNPGRVGFSISGKKRAPIYMRENKNKIVIRIFKGDGQISKRDTRCKIRFEIFDGKGGFLDDKYYAYALQKTFSSLHRGHCYSVEIIGGVITNVLSEIT